MEHRERREKRRELHRWARAYRNMERLQDDIKNYTARLESCYSINAQVLTGMPRGSGVGDPTMRNAAAAIELAEKFQAEIDRINKEIEDEVEFKARMDERLKSLTAVEMDIIERRYLRGGSFYEIAKEKRYSEVRVKEIEARALDKI